MKSILHFLIFSFPLFALAQPNLTFKPAIPGKPPTGWARVNVPNMGTYEQLRVKRLIHMAAQGTLCTFRKN